MMPDVKETLLLDPGRESTYWFSIDSKNGFLRYGKNFRSKSMTLLEVVLKERDERTGLRVWKKPDSYAWLEKAEYVDFRVWGTKVDEEKPLQMTIYKLTIVSDLSPIIKSSDELKHLNHLEDGTFTVPNNLPRPCQQLYAMVSGKTLDSDDFPEFTQAIQRSCTTRGLWAYEVLQQKSQQFGHSDPDKSYLRITLGHNRVSLRRRNFIGMATNFMSIFRVILPVYLMCSKYGLEAIILQSTIMEILAPV